MSKRPLVTTPPKPTSHQPYVQAASSAARSEAARVQKFEADKARGAREDAARHAHKLRGNK
jgi:hypothetical protein